MESDDATLDRAAGRIAIVDGVCRLAGLLWREVEEIGRSGADGVGSAPAFFE